MSNSSHNGKIPLAQPVLAIDNTIAPDTKSTPGETGATAADFPASFPIIDPPPRRCFLRLPQGCYQLNITTSGRTVLSASYRLGTLWVEQRGGNYIVSGDTYRSFFDQLFGGGIPGFGPTEIPVYPRSRYASYLKVTNVVIPFASFGLCGNTLDVEEYNYTQPPPAGFDGTFATVASRSLRLFLVPAAPPSGFTGVYFTEQVSIAGVLQSNMSVTLAWVSSFFRKASFTKKLRLCLNSSSKLKNTNIRPLSIDSVLFAFHAPL